MYCLSTLINLNNVLLKWNDLNYAFFEQNGIQTFYNEEHLYHQSKQHRLFLSDNLDNLSSDIACF